MTPYIYSDSPIVTPDPDPQMSGPAVGAVAQNVRLEHGYLSDQWGMGFTLMTFGDESLVVQHPHLKCLHLPLDGPVARAYGAKAGHAYLIRPDMHVAARCAKADRPWVHAALQRALGEEVGSQALDPGVTA
jgi:3-(3-hydroxy-phenyl)propionate hydroxylase